ncbi:DMT family transporter [Helicobacter sp. 23-1044]
MQYSNSRASSWIMLISAIALEICALSILKVLDNAGQGTIGKVALVVLMNISYFLMSLTLRQIAVGVAYATWEIVGGIGVLLVSFAFFDPHLSTAQCFGIALGFIGIICIILGEKHEVSATKSPIDSANQNGDFMNQTSNSALDSANRLTKSAESIRKNYKTQNLP